MIAYKESPSTMMTQATYIEYLLSTTHNYTRTYLADYALQVSYNQVNQFLRRSYLSSMQLRALILLLLNDLPESFLFFDNSAQDESYSRFIEVAKHQYSGAAYGLKTSICLVNLVHSSDTPSDFLPLDYRVYSPKQDGRTKNEYFQNMFTQIVGQANIQVCTLLFDAWYSGSDNVKLILQAGRTFFTTLRSNQSMGPSEEPSYQALDVVALLPVCRGSGLEMRLKQVLSAVRLFKLVALNGDTKWVVTNNFGFTLTQQLVEAAARTCWQVEELYRSFKQLTCAEKCQCRRA